MLFERLIHPQYTLRDADIEEFQRQDVHSRSVEPLSIERLETLKEWLRDRALQLGFAKVGFAACGDVESERAHVERWFAEGGARHLPYLDLAKLMDPRCVMPEAKTALVGFFPYARPDAIPGAKPGTVKLSRYLWGEDYHPILKGRLKQLLEEAQERWPELHGRACVDTAPLLEKALAVRAGLGWQGKHTLLIAGKAGSWGFLGVLLLDAELEPDAPFETAFECCGSCTRCIEACPSGALSPFRLDPNRCLSTYTLQTEAEPPPEVREAMARTRWVAGCDACQEACPWNREPLWGDPQLWGGPSVLHESSADQLPMTASRWKKLTGLSALRRVRHRHWLKSLGMVTEDPR
jgi:epoxyqueuosine reductase